MCGAFDDEGPDTPPAERFKMLIMDGKVLASPDAIVWSGAPPTPFRLRNVDARSKANLCFRRAPERHLAGQRSRHGRRAAGLRLLRAHRAALRLHLARAPWRPPRLPPLHARRRCFLNFAALAVSLTWQASTLQRQALGRLDLHAKAPRHPGRRHRFARRERAAGRVLWHARHAVRGVLHRLPL